ncbi:hypothetical protein VC0101557_05330 [Vibrio cholerae VC0101557]|uniref:Uncharacterized protein n=4 Tax=Vibrio cholerae TaxID=666 RepID=Q9KVN7_VIBCH|nr:hypothetical protein VC_0104 [Vibrio cholerae O1 biovar El Tor str. N16961]ABQ21339.1 hypothetical protein VC0395_A2414 [Vibrio cholerae O395]ACP04440.1 conserved hypothetical protein [Vibrio cholerae M66-2]AEA77415.1 hypothetical protein VCLMA_A0096 [Vibrio cholerae LMA3984-4]AET27881.1 conserved hypothetical protein [Vibrio cholerae O1 str. 2010EL-1786]APF47728.1 hypothetical protein ASZ80_00104 [Vibrio cholerae]EAZ71423.1 hypothetical protein A5C_0116 [Vibrio cholerae NCTC 8457]EAZ7540
MDTDTLFSFLCGQCLKNQVLREVLGKIISLSARHASGKAGKSQK